MNTLYISLLASFVYSITLALKIRSTFANQSPLTKSSPLKLLLLCIVLHAFALYSHIFNHPQGINLGFYNVISLISWFILIICWLSIARKIEIDNTLFAIIPFCILSLLCNEFLSSNYYPKGTLSHGVIAHIILSVLAYSVLSIACIQALLLFIQEINLKNQRSIKALSWLPPLESMEDLLFNLITFGLILLSVAITTGAFNMEDVLAQHLSHKLVFTLLSWLIFTALLAGRYFYGWRGITAIKWTFVGFILLLLAYVGSTFVLEIVLNRHEPPGI